VSANSAITEANNISADNKAAEEKRKLWYLPYNEHKKMAELIDVQQRMIKRYIDELKPWISIAHRIEKEGKLYDVITVLKNSILRPKYEASQRGKRVKDKVYPERSWYMYYIKSFCRRNRINEEDVNLSDTADLIKQYRDQASKCKLNIMNLICKAIKNTTSTVLNSINVHKALKNLIDYDFINYDVAIQ
jgi:predicted transcriptional regulator